MSADKQSAPPCSGQAVNVGTSHRLPDPWPNTVAGVPIYLSHAVERGRIIIGFDPNGTSGRRVIFEGRGLGRGIAYTAPGVERGYVVSMHNPLRYDLVDATTGRVVRVLADECVEVETRYRHPTIKETFGA